MGVVTVRSTADLLDRLAERLTGQFGFAIRRPARDQLEVELDGAAYPLVRMRVEAALRELAPSAAVEFS